MNRTMRRSMFAAASLFIAIASARGDDAAAPASQSTAAPKPSPPLASKFSISRLALEQSAGRDRDPIRYFVMDLDDVTGLLADLKTHEPTQPKQAAFSASLDQLIAALEKSASGSGGSNPNPTKPMADSRITKGPGGSGPMHDPAAGTKIWGNLPPKEREQILQSQNEGFPSGYESILSSYYKRLAQESVQADAAPTTQP